MEDYISRKTVLDIIGDVHPLDYNLKSIIYQIQTIPGMIFKEGKWVDGFVGDMPVQVCDQCNTFFPMKYTGGWHRFCPNCGAKMIFDDGGNESNE